MSCGTCVRWTRRVKKPHEVWRRPTRYGFCRCPSTGPRPYWQAQRPEAVLMTAEVHGEGCAAYREKKARR